MPNRARHSLAKTTLAMLAIALLAPTIAAAVTLPTQGVLRSQSGGPVTDGLYPMTFRLYASADAKDALFEQVELGVQVKGGMFAVVLGSQAKVPLAISVFADNKALFFSLQVSIDPELPRRPLGMVPYAGRAAVADALAGKLDGKQIQAGTLPASALAFAAAGSVTKGGPASGLQCTGCIGKGHLAPGLLDAANIQYAVGGVTTKVSVVLNQLTDLVRTDGKGVGIGKTPAKQCTVDLQADNGTVCVGGNPAKMVVLADSATAMNDKAQDGQMVYRSDNGNAYMRSKGKWRRLQFAAECGDGIAEQSEACDDGNPDNTDACTTKCLLNVCGDGHAYKGKELCDDGNKVNTDACVACKPAACGDGYIQAGVEKCDGLLIGAATCTTEKGDGWTGKVACAKGCKAFDTSGCTAQLGSQSNPGATCKAILAAVPGANDGVYYLKAAGKVFKAWCGMKDGGWTLVASWSETGKKPASWGRELFTATDPKPASRHALPFIDIFAGPKEVKFIYSGNGQNFTRSLTGSWQEASGPAARIKTTDGNYLIFGQQTEPGGICVVNGNYSDGYLCDGNSNQINGVGLFNANTADEACNCNSYGWKATAGGCNYSVCGPTALTLVYLR